MSFACGQSGICICSGAYWITIVVVIVDGNGLGGGFWFGNLSRTDTDHVISSASTLTNITQGISY